ncbi:hypothetical protein [uncultured Tateyamaria sp.]|uniref:hypothetical protein n=1 Tax=uncultured Tateyamaria sp. TaxID=455651 RepID=UPI00260995D4|nr:hypothetical protein [uncultured Tateyamaria sp.]
MTRKFALIASTALVVSAAPLLADDYSGMKFDPANTLAGDTNRVATIDTTEGGNVVTSDGVLLGQIEDFNIGENDRAEIMIDMEAGLRFDGDTMDLTIDPENVTVVNGGVALSPSADDLYAAVGLGGQNTAGPVEIDFK